MEREPGGQAANFRRVSWLYSALQFRSSIHRILGVVTVSPVVKVASVPDRDEPAAEIWWNDEMVAEIRRGNDGACLLDIYPSPSGKRWSFGLEEWLRQCMRLEDASIARWARPEPISMGTLPEPTARFKGKDVRGSGRGSGRWFGWGEGLGGGGGRSEFAAEDLGGEGFEAGGGGGVGEEAFAEEGVYGLVEPAKALLAAAFGEAVVGK